MSTERTPFVGYGVNDIRGWDRDTGESLFHFRYADSINSEFTTEVESLQTGSYLFDVFKAVKTFKSSLKCTVQEYDPDASAILLGGTLTEYTAGTSGDIIDEENLTGTSLYSATGFSAVTPLTGSEANIKEGWYVAKATSTTTFDIYAYSSANFSRGSSISYQDENGKVTSTPLSIPSSTGAVVDVTALGIQFVRGGTARNVVSGDTFRFYCQKPTTTGSYQIKFGSINSTFNNIGVTVSSQTEDGNVMYLTFYKCLVSGMSIPLKSKGVSSYDISVEPMYDTDQDAFGIMRVSRK